jgi:iron-sulfur cluster assembly protein
MITVTDLAKQHIKKSIAARGKGLGILIGTRTSGCSGLAYILEFVDVEKAANEFDRYEFDDVKIWISVTDRVYLDGMTIDYVRKGLNEGFEFINPNEASRCGCGESFKI